MGWKTILSLVFILLVVVLLVLYWFVPFKEREFFAASKNSNFSVGNETSDMQFYQNMRYLSPDISYKIYDACTIKKRSDMEQALGIVENLTILDFYAVNSGEEISVTCSDEVVFEEGMFVGGEGGVTNVTVAGNFNVIYNGKVLLIRDSDCSTPNIAIHELLHALGFGHSENSNNIMYAVSKCRQTIGDDIPNVIDELYSVPNYPDLILENVSAVMRGKYLDASMIVKNNGLKKSGEAKLKIYADEKLVKEIDVDEIEIGYGRIMSFSNLFVTQLSVSELEFSVDAGFEELDKKNNKVFLELK